MNIRKSNTDADKKYLITPENAEMTEITEFGHINPTLIIISRLLAKWLTDDYELAEFEVDFCPSGDGSWYFLRIHSYTKIRKRVNSQPAVNKPRKRRILR